MRQRGAATQYVARLVGLNLYTGTLEVATHRVLLDVGGTFTITLGDDDLPMSAVSAVSAGAGSRRGRS